MPLAARAVCGIDVFGSLNLNDPAGGLNPWTVETAIRYGAKRTLCPPWTHVYFRSVCGRIDSAGRSHHSGTESPRRTAPSVVGTSIRACRGRWESIALAKPLRRADFLTLVSSTLSSKKRILTSGDPDRLGIPRVIQSSLYQLRRVVFPHRKVA